MDTIIPGQFSDAEDDDFEFETSEVQSRRGQKRKNESDESESEDQQAQYYSSGQFSDAEDDDFEFETSEVQAGRGEKRKHQSDDESESEDEQGQYYYQLESSKKYHSEKFGMTATDHRVRFNNVLADRDLLESYENSLRIFHHLLEEVKEGMAPNDQVRFILRSEQLEIPISLPFMTVE